MSTPRDQQIFLRRGALDRKLERGKYSLGKLKPHALKNINFFPALSAT